MQIIWRGSKELLKSLKHPASNIRIAIDFIHHVFRFIERVVLGDPLLTSSHPDALL